MNIILQELEELRAAGVITQASSHCIENRNRFAVHFKSLSAVARAVTRALLQQPAHKNLKRA